MITDVRTRIDKDLKENASRILEREGITVNEFIRQALIRVVEEQNLPFKTNIPNEKTLQAMKESREIGKRLEAKYRGVLFDDRQ